MEILYATPRVKKFLKSLNAPAFTRTKKVFQLLRDQGDQLGMPFSRPLGEGLFELRIFGRTQVRLFYIFKEGVAILLHGFIKKTQQIPRKEIEYARKISRLLAS